MNHEIIAEDTEYGLIALYLKEGLLCDLEIDSPKHPYYYNAPITASLTKIDTALKASIAKNDQGDEFLLRDTSLPTGKTINAIISKLAPGKLPEIKQVETLPPLKDAIKRLQERTDTTKVTHQTEIIDHYDLWPALEALKDTTISTNDGRITIETTTALTAIDVDQSSAKNALTVNLKLTKLIAKQIILRKLSGIILIDFIRMKTDQQKRDVEKKLQSTLQQNPTQCHFHGFTRAGLYELTIERQNYPTHYLLEK